MTRVSNSRDWRDVMPGLGLVLGAGLGLLVGVLVPDATDALALMIIGGATLGLVLGSMAWVLQRRE